MTFLMCPMTARGANGKQTEGLLLNEMEGKLHLVIERYLLISILELSDWLDVYCTFDKQIRLHRLTCTKVRLSFTDREKLCLKHRLYGCINCLIITF